MNLWVGQVMIMLSGDFSSTNTALIHILSNLSNNKYCLRKNLRKEPRKVFN